MTSPPKLLLIGIDGGTYRIIKPGIKSNRLPTFKKFFNEGVSGILTSTIPPATVPAFPTLMTGKNPGKHGVFDFMVGIGKEIKVLDGTKIKGPTLWRILSDAGKKCIVVNMPMTYPPEKIDGIIVSGMMTPGGRDFTYPKEVAKILEDLTGGYPVNFERYFQKFQRRKFLEAIHTMIEKRHQGICYLLENWEWDVFAVLFRATDVISHNMFNNYREVLRVYEHIDKVINDLAMKYHDAHIILFSDHGFKPYTKRFNVNVFLKSLGLLKTRKRRRVKIHQIRQKLGVQGAREGLIRYFLVRAGITLPYLRKLVPLKLRKLIGRVVSFRKWIPETNLEVDIRKSKACFAFMGTDTSLSITIRESNQRDYDSIIRLLRTKLVNLTDPATGNKIVKQFFLRDDIYNGPFTERAPDIYFLLEEGYEASSGVHSSQIIEHLPFEKGTHSINGIFLAKGPHVKTGAELQDIRIRDLAPTILHMLGEPIPQDIDGKIQHEIFRDGSPPAKRKPTFYAPESEKRRKHRFTKAEEEEIKERLRSLGYID